MHNETRTDLFSTNDIVLASYIIAKQALKFTKASVEDGNPYAAFHFYDPDNRGESLAVELASGATAPALLLCQTIRTLKAQSYKLQKRNAGGRQ